MTDAHTPEDITSLFVNLAHGQPEESTENTDYKTKDKGQNVNAGGAKEIKKGKGQKANAGRTKETKEAKDQGQKEVAGGAKETKNRQKKITKALEAISQDLTVIDLEKELQESQLLSQDELEQKLQESVSILKDIENLSPASPVLSVSDVIHETSRVLYPENLDGINFNTDMTNDTCTGCNKLTQQVKSLEESLNLLWGEVQTLKQQMPAAVQSIPVATKQTPSFSPQMPSFSPQMPSFSPQMPSFLSQIPSFSPQTPSCSSQIPSCSKTPSLSPMPTFSPQTPSTSKTPTSKTPSSKTPTSKTPSSKTPSSKAPTSQIPSTSQMPSTPQTPTTQMLSTTQTPSSSQIPSTSYMPSSLQTLPTPQTTDEGASGENTRTVSAEEDTEQSSRHSTSLGLADDDTAIYNGYTVKQLKSAAKRKQSYSKAAKHLLDMMFTAEEREGRCLEDYRRTKKDGTRVSREGLEDQVKLIALQEIVEAVHEGSSPRKIRKKLAEKLKPSASPLPNVDI